MTSSLFRLLLASLLIALSPALLAAPQLAANAELLTLAVGSGELLRLPAPAATVFIADPDIADVQVPKANAVFVLGKKAGATTLYALDAAGQTLLQRRVVVQHNVAELNRLLRQRFPDLRLTLESAPGSLMVSGAVNSAQEINAIVQTLQPSLDAKETLINRLTLTSPTQVHLRVRFTEVSREVVQQLGINWSAIGTSGNAMWGLFSGRQTMTDAGKFILSPTGGFSLGGGYQNGNKSISGVLDVLDREGLITTLAEPNLTALSGETASFLAGGQFPVPVAQTSSGSGSAPVITVDFKSFGVALDFTPTVLANDRISLKVRPEVSELSQANSVTMSGVTIPGLSIRRVETTIELGSGQSFAIGGLLQSNVRDILSQLPGLGQLPVLGKLFSSTDYQNSKSELVVIVTPYLVKPTGAGQLRSALDSIRPATDVETVLQQQTGLDPLDGNTPRLTGDAGFVY